jgi:signal peptidase II
MKKILSFLIIGLVILFDQATKYWALGHLTDEYPRKILSILDLRLALNHGVAFSLFYSKGLATPWLLIALTSILSMVVFYLFIHSKEKFHDLAYVMILGGAFANIIDRLRFGAVIDFIDVHFAQYHWPVFNIADSFICLGAFLLIIFAKKNK